MGRGVCLQHFLLFLSCFILCQEESKVDLAFQWHLQHHCYGKLLQKKDGHGQPWLFHKGVEGMTGGSSCARGMGDSWRKQEECDWCGTREFVQGNCLKSIVLERKKLIFSFRCRWDRLCLNCWVFFFTHVKASLCIRWSGQEGKAVFPTVSCGWATVSMSCVTSRCGLP